MRPWEANDLWRMEAVGEPQLSPDAKYVAYVHQVQDADKDRACTSIWLGEVDTGSVRPLTTGLSDRMPRWAPDGRRLAFVSDRSGKPQLWVIDVTGGEARQLETAQRVESAPAWSPSGDSIAFVSRTFAKEPGWIPYPGAPDGDAERGRAAAGQAPGDRDRTPPPLVVTDQAYRSDGAGYAGDLKRHIFTIPVPGPGATASRPEARQLTTGDWNHQEPSWSPDGTRIAFTALRREPDYEDHFRSDLWWVEVANGRLVHVLSGAGPVSAPVWAPDGRSIAFLGHDQRRGRSTTTGLWLVPVAAPAEFPLGPGSAVNLTTALDRPVGVPVPSDVRYLTVMAVPPVWLPDSSGLLFLAPDRGVGKLYRVTTAGRCPEAVAGSPKRSLSFFTAAGPVLAYQAGSDVDPDQIFTFDRERGERRLTQANAGLLKEAQVAPAERFSFAGAGGWEIDGWLVRPPGFDPSRRYPLVLSIHGGPHGIYGHAFMFLAQYLASSGYLVLYTNPRGSQSYGQEFASAVVGDWGGRDYEDLMAGVDYVVDQGNGDPRRLGVTGWSYGGYMTNWIVGRTDRFAAAVTGACVFNLPSFYGTSDIGFTFGEFQWQGRPWDAHQRLLERSPLAHVDRVATPMLILHGEADLRCPVEQAEQLYTALKRRGQEAVMVRYPGEYHALKRPSYRVDRYHRTRHWFDHYLCPSPSGTQPE